MATSTIFNFNFNNSEIVDSTGQWYDATTGTPTTEFIEHDGNTALLQRAYIAGTAYTRDINPVFFQSRDPTFTAHTYTIELQIYPLRDSGGFGPEPGPVLDFNPDADDEEGWVSLVSVQRASISNTFYWHEYGLGPDGTGIPFLTVTAADGTYNRWYSIRIERVDDGTNTGATVKIYVDGALVVNETLTYPQDARRGRIGNSIRYTYRRSSIDPQGAGAAIDNFKLTAGIAPSSVVDVSLANLQRNNANLLSFIKGKVPTVNDGTLTIQKNGTNVATFTANQSTAATANITVPTAVSELTNDSGYLTSSSNLDASKLTSGTVDIARLPQGALERLIKVANEAARYALTTADVQLGDTVQQLDTGIMYVVTDTDHLDSAAGYTEYTAGTAASVPWSGVTGKPTFAAVATSGAYSDLTGTPTIPTVNNATLTIQQNGTDVATFSANSSTNATANITVPTKTSDLTNDSGFITSDNTKIPLTGTNALAGSIVPSTDNSVNLGDSTYGFASFYVNKLYLKGSTIFKLVDDSFICLGGATAQANGANLVLNGKNRSTSTGEFKLEARDGINARQLIGEPDGTLTWSGTVSTNSIEAYSVTSKDTSNSSILSLLGGNSYPNGAQINLYGNNHQDNGSFEIVAHGNAHYLRGDASGTLTWDGQSIQTTSDQRLKQQIAEIDDDLLMAWEDVNPVQFKYNDAVDAKKDKARLHTGYVVQQIDKACREHGVDVSKYGLYCHEEYAEETREVEHEDGTKVKERKVIREASEHYSLRYTEALIVECAYLRKCIKELRSEIEELKSSK